MTQQTLQLQGMSCASCAQAIERIVSRMEGVEECSVNFGAAIDPQDLRQYNWYVNVPHQRRRIALGISVSVLKPLEYLRIFHLFPYFE